VVFDRHVLGRLHCKTGRPRGRYTTLAPSTRYVVVGHLGGETLLRNAGTFEPERSGGTAPVILTGVYVVEPNVLPAGVIALLGVADIAALGISLDHVLLSPGCPWEQAVPSTLLARIERAFRRCFGLGPPPDRQSPPRRLPRPRGGNRSGGKKARHAGRTGRIRCWTFASRGN
jgi:hypothetical protein